MYHTTMKMNGHLSFFNKERAISLARVNMETRFMSLTIGNTSVCAMHLANQMLVSYICSKENTPEYQTRVSVPEQEHETQGG